MVSFFLFLKSDRLWTQIPVNDIFYFQFFQSYRQLIDQIQFLLITKFVSIMM